jgi:hypothetical protein
MCQRHDYRDGALEHAMHQRRLSFLCRSSSVPRIVTATIVMFTIALAATGAATATRWPDVVVAVTGPAGSRSAEELVLEAGETAWLGYGGVVSVPSDAPLPVRLLGRASCVTYASFIAPPGTQWVIRFAADGSVGVEDWTGRGTDAGPALPERPPSGCATRVTGSSAEADVTEAGPRDTLAIVIAAVTIAVRQRS